MNDYDLHQAARQLQMGEYMVKGEIRDREAVARLLAQRDTFRAITVVMLLIAGAVFLEIVKPLATLVA